MSYGGNFLQRKKVDTFNEDGSRVTVTFLDAKDTCHDREIVINKEALTLPLPLRLAVIRMQERLLLLKERNDIAPIITWMADFVNVLPNGNGLSLVYTEIKSLTMRISQEIKAENAELFDDNKPWLWTDYRFVRSHQFVSSSTNNVVKFSNVLIIQLTLWPSHPSNPLTVSNEAKKAYCSGKESLERLLLAKENETTPVAKAAGLESIMKGITSWEFNENYRKACQRILNAFYRSDDAANAVTKESNDSKITIEISTEMMEIRGALFQECLGAIMASSLAPDLITLTFTKSGVNEPQAYPGVFQSPSIMFAAPAISPHRAMERERLIAEKKNKSGNWAHLSKLRSVFGMGGETQTEDDPYLSTPPPTPLPVIKHDQDRPFSVILVIKKPIAIRKERKSDVVDPNRMSNEERYGSMTPMSQFMSPSIGGRRPTPSPAPYYHGTQQGQLNSFSSPVQYYNYNPESSEPTRGLGIGMSDAPPPSPRFTARPGPEPPLHKSALENSEQDSFERAAKKSRNDSSVGLKVIAGPNGEEFIELENGQYMRIPPKKSQ